MDKIKERMNALRVEADEAHDQVEELKAKVKTLEQENLSKEQEITSLNHRNQLLEEEVEKAETSLKEAKDAANQSAQHDTQNEALQRRVQLLEEEAEENDRTLRETNEKYDPIPFMYLKKLQLTCVIARLRQTDVKAGHYERKVQALETERDQWESKYEEMAKKHAELQKDLHELEVSISNV
ncbi:hypothetical protein N7462_006239 [Penicillium macrosclerotiorum]|uniref:uncharacterized protein n=1 Tax=Penicillium macrosclerotiorum TaxID=303699 RepID=UPI0025468C84|nr:uncharacterized protein N7462_006239 [Penicillium macrosclerotiorum]KAJ5683074.1 hypothetical protein N7462_006239 [Penicillium macrosclerotiorum]